MPILPTSAWNFSGGSEPAISPTISSADSINLYPEIEPPAAHTPVALIGTPGLSLIAAVGAGPIRGMVTIGGVGLNVVVLVSGNSVYTINPLTGAVLVAWGAIAGTDSAAPCRFAYNGTQILVVDPSVPGVFYLNPVGPSVDLVFAGGLDLAYQDTFFFASNQVAVNGVNASASLDGLTWPGLSVTQRTGVSDLMSGLATVNGQLWMLGVNNIEVWANVGQAGFPFAKISYGTINVGTLSDNNSYKRLCLAVSVAGNTIVWLGADVNGFAVVYQASGLDPVRVSTPAIESYIASIGNLANAKSFCYQEAGHLFYVLTFPLAVSGNGATIAYDLTTRLWHKRAYLSGSTLQRIRANCFCSIGSGTTAKNIVGDYANANVYQMGLSFPSDGGTDIQRTRIAPIASDQNEWLSHGSFRLDGVFGAAVPTLGWSDDGGVTYNKAQFNLSQTGTAAASGISTWQAHQLGRSRQRAYKVQITSSADLVRLSNAYLDVNQ